MVVASDSMTSYFISIDEGVSACYSCANKARAKGFDPDKEVSIPLAKDMSERVEGLISVVAPQIKNAGISERIKELEKKYGSQDWRVGMKIALEIAQEKFCKFKDKVEAMEVGIRAGFSYVTVGVVSSPLEGFLRLELKQRRDGNGEYFCLFYGGPIRSAGGTGASVSVLIADYVRSSLGYAVYDPTEEEIKRTSSELDFFHERITNLQYHPSNKEAEFLTKYLPVQINGDPSEKLEVPNYKDLSRIATNNLRNGFCLVMAECLSLKAPKLWKRLDKFKEEMKMDHWIFLEKFIKLQKEIRAKGEVKKKGLGKILPDHTFVKDIVAGRPVLGYPMQKGGFRIRFGRTRTSGFSSDAFHPASLYFLNGFIAIGTQLKVERPGKATSVAVCDSIEGPIVKLNDGSVVFVETVEQAKEISKDVDEVLFLGDVLINYGDFLDRAHILFPPGYCEEWWVLELEKALGEKAEEYKELIENPFNTKVKFNLAYDLSKKYKVPLYPYFSYRWKEVEVKDLLSLIDWVSNSTFSEEKIVLPLQYDIRTDLSDKSPKRILELIGVPHKVVNKEYVVIEGDWASSFRVSLGCFSSDLDIEKCFKVAEGVEDSLEFINLISEVKIRAKSGLCMGCRMGRPEKGKMRKLTGSPHVLFPIGEEGGRMRCFQSALDKGFVKSEFPLYYCNKCEADTIFPLCHKCKSKTEKRYFSYGKGVSDKEEENSRSYSRSKIDVREYFNYALKNLGIRHYPDLIKGVRGTSNQEHIPERIEKGILRALNGIHVNKDGTTRFDMTELSCTHFKPFEIGTSVSKLKELGYLKDIHGSDLVRDDQILELKCQDIILPSCVGAIEEGADKILFRVAKFIDDLLVKFYGVNSFYNLKTKDDLVGHLCIGLSPHTAAGIICRIIGFSQIQGLLAHPYLHSIMRRDTDGDEACVMMLMDALLNFSRKLLSNHRGATQDEPLVLTSTLLPEEVDDMVFNMDTVWKYPLSFYEACLEYKYPWDVKMEIVDNRLGKAFQYEGFGYTHPCTDFNEGVKCSMYKLIPTMKQKVEGQMNVAEKLRSVRASDVARLTIERHFLRDIKGNLRKFSQQRFRCVNCNEKYRRPPLTGKCTNCPGGKIIFTISEGSVIKYLEPSLSLAKKYDLPVYLQQTLDLLKQRIELVFGKDKETQEGLGKWFG